MERQYAYLDEIYGKNPVMKTDRICDDIFINSIFNCDEFKNIITECLASWIFSKGHSDGLALFRANIGMMKDGTDDEYFGYNIK
jgi:hypothetical protein